MTHKADVIDDVTKQMLFIGPGRPFNNIPYISKRKIINATQYP